MKKLTASVLAVVLSSSFALVDAQKIDSTKTKDIEGVVVTALGIKREKKSLGFSSQEVKSDELFGGTTNTGNVASQLSGKVAGLNVNTNSNFGGASTMVIRGIKSVSGSNPLIVIDGSPVNNSPTYSGNYNEGYDLGNALSDINQEDIASVNVLKGAAASALYGERGLNGVIVITTKNGRGKDDGSWGATLSTSVQVGFIDKSTFPKYQSTYGGGYDPSFYYGTTNGHNNSNYGEDASWGPAFDNSQVVAWDYYDPTSPNYHKTTAYAAAKNGPISFFQHPISYVNSFTLSKGDRTNNFSLTYDNNTSSGLMPNSAIGKNTLSTKINYDFTPKLHATVYSTLTLQNTRDRNETGYSSSFVTGFREWWQVSTDMKAQQSAYFNNIGQPSPSNNYGNVSWNRTSASNGKPIFWNNAYFQDYQNYESDNRTRTFSYAQLVYDIDKHLNVLGKVSYDNTAILFERRLAMGSVPQDFGLSRKTVGSGYDRENINQREINYDAMLNYKYDLTSDINVSGVVGGSVKRADYSSIEASTEGGLILPFLYSLGNSRASELAPKENVWTTQTNSIYGTASFDFYKIFYLDATYRHDVSSTLPATDNKYNYGSISGSLILSEFLKSQKNWLSFWKVRGNYAEVGGTADPYELARTYTSGGVFNGSVGIFNTSTTLPNPNLVPQRSKEYEFGTEIQLLHNRITFDGAYYNSKTLNQLITPAISAGSGQSYAYLNAGEIDNKGVEMHLGLVPIKSTNFTWSLDANWAKNRSMVVSLGSGLSSYPLVGMAGGVSVVADVGKAWGDLYGSDYVYLNGQKVVDPTTGLYETNANQIIGNVMPKWTGGLRNTFAYKSFAISFLIDVRKGGDIFSTDMYYGLAGGLYQETAAPGYRTNVLTLAGVNPNGQVNTTPVSSDFDPAGYSNNANDSYTLAPQKRFVYDGSFVKLREASISYSLPKSLLTGTSINDAKISIVGRNLWIIHKNLPYADPEATQMGGIYSYGSSIGSLPATRTVGVNLTFKF